jgi:hypothetical protein
MKKIKTFEDFRKINEISTNLANQASMAARNKQFDDGDHLGNERNIRQHKKFVSYVNPEFKNKIKLLGFEIEKSGYDEITLSGAIAGQGVFHVYISPDKYEMDADAKNISDTTLNKLNRAVKLTQQELKSAKPANNEL